MANKPLQSITFPELDDKYTVPVVDNTLTTTGAAADAKKTGDEISSIKEDLSELSDLKKNVEYDTGLVFLDVNWESGYISTNVTIGTTVNVNSITSSNETKHAVISVEPGDIYTLSLSGGNASRAWCITDDEYTSIAVSPQGYSAENDEIIIPSDGAYIILHNNAVDHPLEPKVIKGRISENKTKEINNKLATILGNEYISKKKDDNRWLNPSASFNYIRMTEFIDDGVISMSAPKNVLRVELIDLSTGLSKGFWVEKTGNLVAQNVVLTQSFIDLTKIRKAYPDYLLVAECTETKDPSYAAENIDVYYTPYEYRDGVRKNYINVPLNSADCQCKQISISNGNLSNSLDWMSTIDYVPDYWARVKAPRMQLIAYDSSGVFVGAFNLNGFVVGNHSGMSDIDFEKLRGFYPNYKFKINIYSQDMDLSEIGVITVDKDKMDAKLLDQTCYKIPTRFTRTNIYSVDIPVDEGMVKANINGQGFCTDGTYLYCAVLKLNYVVIKKLATDGTLIDEKNVGDMGHANQLAYDPNNNRILVASGTAYVYTVDPDTLEAGESFQLSNVLDAINTKYPGTLTQIWNIAYYQGKNVFLVGSGTTFAVTNADFTKVLKVIRMDIGGGQRQFIYPKDEYIINAFAEGEYDYSATDWNGRIITTFNNQRTYAQTIYSELEGVCEIDGVLYCYWNKAGGAHVTVTREDRDGYAIIPVAEVQKKFDYGC